MNRRHDRVIWWIKRDFRLTDNEALLLALAEGQRVLPLFVFEPSTFLAKESSFFHLHAQWQALKALSDSIESVGGKLQSAQGEVVDVLEQLRCLHGFDALYSHQETGTDISYQRDIKVQEWTAKHKIPWHELPQNGVVRKLHSRDDRQRIFKERMFDCLPKPAPARIPTWQGSCLENTVPEIESIPVSESHCHNDSSLLQAVTEQHGLRECERFLTIRGRGYSGGISSPNSAFKVGSRLSPHLAWGTISLRSVFHQSTHRLRELEKQRDGDTMQWKKSIRAFQSRLHWHDHFIQRLESAPRMEFESLNPAYQSVAYLDDAEVLRAWYLGETGIPLLDACMRCLRSTGFLNFRMRAMAVTTACFGLGQSWCSIHHPLAQVFLDYEPGIHLSQIQMQAGIVGINTLRVYSPHKQLIEQDPECVFVKKWVPELRDFSISDIRNYETKSLGDYPKPIVDIADRAKFMKDQIYAIRKSEEGKEASAIILSQHGSRRPVRRRKMNTKKTTNKRAADADPQMKMDI